MRFQMRAIVVAVVLGLSGAAWGQATRTWVSGFGDDVNPCSRTAPCATFAMAILKTAARGEIDILDPGDFGPLTIKKSITIDGHLGGGRALVLAASRPIKIQAGPTDTVVLRGLTIDGVGVGATGIQFVTGGPLSVEECTLDGFTGAAIDFEPALGGRLFVRDTVMRASGS